MVEPLWGTRASASARGPETGDPESEETAHWEMVTAPLPPRRRAGWRIFCSCSTIGPEASGTQNFTKSSFLSLWVPRGGELRAVHHGIASLLLSRQRAAVGAQELPFCPFVEPGKGCNTRVPASYRHMPGCHKPQAGFLRFLPHDEESGECYTSHQDPAPAVTGQAVTGPAPGPCVPPRCPTKMKKKLVNVTQLTLD